MSITPGEFRRALSNAFGDAVTEDANGLLVAHGGVSLHFALCSETPLRVGALQLLPCGPKSPFAREIRRRQANCWTGLTGRPSVVVASSLSAYPWGDGVTTGLWPIRSRAVGHFIVELIDAPDPGASSMVGIRASGFAPLACGAERRLRPRAQAAALAEPHPRNAGDTDLHALRLIQVLRGETVGFGGLSTRTAAPPAARRHSRKPSAGLHAAPGWRRRGFRDCRVAREHCLGHAGVDDRGRRSAG